MKSFLKKLMPKWLLEPVRPVYHGLLALLAKVYFGNPGSKMKVIGVTGTAGKSTTIQMLAKILNAAGRKCGFITTVSFFDGSTEQINKHGLSMPGGWLLQKQLKQMLNNGCRFAVVECTSEGLAQNRHLGLNFDAAVFTNLSEAHLEAHGGIGNYRWAKGELFRKLKPDGTTIANLDDGNADYFLSFSAAKKIGATFLGKNYTQCHKIYQAQNKPNGFALEGQDFEVKLIGNFNNYNALLAAAGANQFGVSLGDCAKAIKDFTFIKGRMEPVANNKGLQIFIDYGCEPATILAALQAVNKLPHQKIIHVFGSTGGHRDVSKRFIFGQTSARLADAIIITNDDVYDSNPNEIADNIKQGIEQVPVDQRRAKFVSTILDRRQAIKHALKIAQAGDIVIITGKASEQFLVLPGNRRIDWDETTVVKEELDQLS